MTEHMKHTHEMLSEIQPIIEDINTEVDNSHYGDFNWALDKALDIVVEKYGFDNVANATAIMIDNVGRWDLRIERKTYNWAKIRCNEFMQANGLDGEFSKRIRRGNIHSVLLNGFGECVMKREGGGC